MGLALERGSERTRWQVDPSDRARSSQDVEPISFSQVPRKGSSRIFLPSSRLRDLILLPRAI